MPLILQPAAAENTTQRAEVQLAAFTDDPVFTSLLRGVPYEEQLKFFADSLAKDHTQPGVRNLEIIDTETSKVVAFAQWKYPTPKSAQEETGLEQMTFPEGTNLALFGAIFEVYGKLSKSYYDSEKMYFLNYMQVHPTYQRQGLGRRLMQQALLDADKDGAQSYLSASDAGKRLYVKDGFKDLEVVIIDFVHLGAVGVRNTTAMLREPQPVQP